MKYQFFFKNVVSFEFFKTSSFDTWKVVYLSSYWYEKIYSFFERILKKLSTCLMQKTFDYKIVRNVLWIHREKFYLFCISKKKVLKIFKKIHDNSSHWIKTNIMTKIRETCFWFKQFQNVKYYIAKCLKYAHYKSITRFQCLHFVLILYFFQLIDFDFINLLFIIKVRHIYVFN